MEQSNNRQKQAIEKKIKTEQIIKTNPIKAEMDGQKLLQDLKKINKRMSGRVLLEMMTGEVTTLILHYNIASIQMDLLTIKIMMTTGVRSQHHSKMSTQTLLTSQTKMMMMIGILRQQQGQL